MSRRWVAAVAALLALSTIDGCGRISSKPPTVPAIPAASPSPSDQVAMNPGPYQAGPVSPPATGALLGAWVRPPALTQPDRIDAVDEFQSSLGRELDIVNTYRRMDETFPSKSDRAFAKAGATLMLSWAVDHLSEVQTGADDAEMRDWAREMGAFPGRILLRFRWEMDRPNLAEDVGLPANYIAAWKHLRQVFAAERVSNVSWVWCPTAQGFQAGYAQTYYPGDDQVDWVCVDAYASHSLNPLAQIVRPFLSWAARHPKPIVIGEFGVARAWGSGDRAGWLAAAANLVAQNPQIKAVSYFDSDPDDSDPYQRFQLDPPALAAFAAFAKLPYFNVRRK